MIIQLYQPAHIESFLVNFNPRDRDLNSRYLLPEFAFLADHQLTRILTTVGGDALLKEIYNKDLSPEGWFDLIHPLDLISILSLTTAYQLNAAQVRELCNEIVYYDMASKNCEAILLRSQVMKRVIDASKAVAPQPILGNTTEIERRIQRGLQSVMSNNANLVKARKMTQAQARLIMNAYNRPQLRLDPEAVGGAKNALIEKSSVFGGISYVELYQQYLDIKNPKPLPIPEPRVDSRPAEAMESYNHLLVLFLRASPNNLNEIRGALGNRAVQVLGPDMRPVQNSFLSPDDLQRGRAIFEKKRAIDPGAMIAQWLGIYEMSLELRNVTEAQYVTRMKNELDQDIKAQEGMMPQIYVPNPNPNPAPGVFPDDFPLHLLGDDHDDPDFDWATFLGVQLEPEPEPVSTFVSVPVRSRSPVIHNPEDLNMLTSETYQAFIAERCKGQPALNRFGGTIASLRVMYVNSIDVPQVIKALSKQQLLDLFKIAVDPNLSIGFVRENFTEVTRKEMPDPQRFVNKTRALFQKWSGQDGLSPAVRAQLKKSEDFVDFSDDEIVETFQNTFKWLDADTMRCIPNAVPDKLHTTYQTLYYLIPIAAVQSAFEEDE